MPQKRLTEEQIRRKLAAAIGHQVRDDIWQALLDDDLIQGFIVGEFEFEDLIERYRHYDSHFSLTAHAQRKEERKEIPPDRRLDTLAQIWAIEASRLPEVISFRQEILQGRLLQLEEIDTWVKQQLAQKQGGARWVKVALPANVEPKNSRDFSCLQSILSLPEKAKAAWPIEWSVDILEYPGTDKWVNKVPVPHFGPLRRLKDLASCLQGIAPLWQEAQAVAFVLCDVVPALPKARGTLHFSSIGPARVTLELDPRLSSQEVAKLYVRVRRDVFDGWDRPMTEKHLSLSIFLAENPGIAWRELMAIWNRKFPEWIYSDWRVFSRDARAAWQRITGREYPRRPSGKKKGETSNARES
ncbi:MAG: hypothetical protein HPY52_07810 [Firmicutes bacterium]|nr:hypothetical protein [Bacillota bacterium]